MPLNQQINYVPSPSATTQYSYVAGGCPSCSGVANKIDHISLPEGNRIDYFYEATGNLSRIADSQGNSVNYTYDSEGNRLKEDVKDPIGILQGRLRGRS